MAANVSGQIMNLKDQQTLPSRLITLIRAYIFNGKNLATMKIIELKTTAIGLKVSTPLKTSSGTLDNFPLVLIDMHTDQEIVGRAYIFCYDAIFLKPICALAEGLKASIEGQNVDPQQLCKLLEQRFKLAGIEGIARMLQAGIDMAAWDALAQEAQRPLTELLGGNTKTLVPAYYSCFMRGIEGGIEDAETALRKGFTAMKVKLGYDTAKQDLEVLKEIRKISDQIHIMVDYNQSLSAEEAITRGKLIADQNIYWLEEPVNTNDYRGHRQVRDNLPMPIQTGENWWGIADMQQCFAEQASDFIMPDLMKIGGVTNWIKAAVLAEKAGTPISNHLFQEFTIHLLASTPKAHWLEYMDFTNDILQDPLTVENGFAKPGKRLTWNEEAIEKFKIKQ